MAVDPPLFVLWYDFAKWLLGKTEKFPKKVRFTFSQRIEGLALDVVEGIVTARYTKHKADRLRQVDIDIEKLRVLLRMCHDLAFLDHKGYEYAAGKLKEAGSMVGGWRKQQEGTTA